MTTMKAPKVTKCIYERIYDRLNRLTGGINEFVAEHRSLKLQSKGFMDLTIESFGYNGKLALTHYYLLNGDLVPDPDMEILVHPEMKMAEALTYQDTFGFKTVYLDDDRRQFYPSRKKELNQFLNTWLNNLQKQGFYK
ncbi:DUF1249 domain-containing protein [Cohnella sp. AR92]|uniref:DUF1249 domain-containing protein n=1 Tax=Cohnella sp. AR92 TaxID=648716 RepID=UPI000F8DA02A|nr:DUF1249 domain-containing protein [Cohnella sp. AR92]RUS44987.1 DUF1249 domain-containing protein [Cohnella sp. AR92]